VHHLQPRDTAARIQRCWTRINGNFLTTRPVGRPRTRWADVVKWDALQLLGIRGWRRRAANRDEWRHLMREAKARKGL
jgi:hypothetical protein